jgi:sugar porter (SP) family MFS transporter
MSARARFGYRFALLGGVAFGYDLALVGGLLPTLATTLALDGVEKGFVVSAAKGGAVIGAFVGAAAMRCFGRVRSAAVLSACTLPFGSLMCALSADASQVGLAFGRAVVGVGVGALAVIVPAYCGEIADDLNRGRVVACYELSVCMGMILANVSTWFEPSETYKLVLGSPLVIGFWCVVGFMTCPESPRWCVRAGDSERAKESLRALEEPGSNIETLVSTIENEEQRATSSSERNVSFWQALVDTTHGGWREAMNGEERRAVNLILCLAWFNQMSASTSIINYSSRILNEISTTTTTTTTTSGIAMENMYSGLIVAFKTLGVLISIHLVDSFGRRPLLLYGNAFSAFGLSIAGLGFGMTSLPLTLVGLCTFIFAFSCSSASVFWVLVSEFFSMRVKSAAAALVTATLFFAGFISDLIFAPMLNAFHAGTFAFNALWCVAATIFVYFYIPETRRKTFRDIQRVLRNGDVDDEDFAPVYQSVNGSRGIEFANIRTHTITDEDAAPAQSHRVQNAIINE